VPKSPFSAVCGVWWLSFSSSHLAARSQAESSATSTPCTSASAVRSAACGEPWGGLQRASTACACIGAHMHCSAPCAGWTVDALRSTQTSKQGSIQIFYASCARRQATCDSGLGSRRCRCNVRGPPSGCTVGSCEPQPYSAASDNMKPQMRHKHVSVYSWSSADISTARKRLRSSALKGTRPFGVIMRSHAATKEVARAKSSLSH